MLIDKEKLIKDIIEFAKSADNSGKGYDLENIINLVNTQEDVNIESIDYKGMVNRFLCWKLPKDFAPDCGISFKRKHDYVHPEFGEHIYEPVGTNLFTADQAKSMFEYCLADAVKEKWISVKDGLPDFTLFSDEPLSVGNKNIPPLYKTERVLYTVTSGEIFIGRIEKIDETILPLEITHWMPLPEPPVLNEVKESE